MAKTENTAFAPLARGVTFAVEDGHLVLRIETDRAKAVPSASGKMVLITTTPGGFMTVPGTDIRINLNAGYSAKG